MSADDIRPELITPRDWAQIALREASADGVDPAQARASLAQARRYLAIADEFARLHAVVQVLLVASRPVRICAADDIRATPPEAAMTTGKMRLAWISENDLSAQELRAALDDDIGAETAAAISELRAALGACDMDAAQAIELAALRLSAAPARPLPDAEAAAAEPALQAAPAAAARPRSAMRTALAHDALALADKYAQALLRNQPGEADRHRAHMAQLLLDLARLDPADPL